MSSKINSNMIDIDQGEIHAYVEITKTRMDNSVQSLFIAVGKGTKLDAKTYYELIEYREQIVSIRLQSASSAMLEKINYYFKQQMIYQIDLMQIEQKQQANNECPVK